MAFSNHSAANANLIIGLAIGLFFGALTQSFFMSSLPTDNIRKKLETYAMTGVVKNLEDIRSRNTSHIDDRGRPITKQQLLEPFSIPKFVGFSVATFLPGQRMMPVHEHETLHEIFFVLSGSAFIQVDGVDHKVKPGTFLHMAPHEKHGIWVPREAEVPMKMAVCGVVTD